MTRGGLALRLAALLAAALAAGPGVAQALAPASDTPIEATGTVERWLATPTAPLLARRVDVWLPPSYAQSPRHRYPVLYMHDGQNLFDPSLSYAGIDWDVDGAMTRLIERGEIREAIVVGVWNTPARFAEYMPRAPVKTKEPLKNSEVSRARDGALANRARKRLIRRERAQAWPEPATSEPLQDGVVQTIPKKVRSGILGRPAGRAADIVSDDYLRFLVDELKPAIDATYRTLPGRDDSFVMGSSMGGLISLYAAAKYPDVFGGVGAVSTHWPVCNGCVIEWLSTHLPKPGAHRIYYDFGTATLDAQYPPFQAKMDAVMRERGYREGRDWITRRFEGAEHNEAAWKARVEIPLSFLLGRDRSLFHHLPTTPSP